MVTDTATTDVGKAIAAFASQLRQGKPKTAFGLTLVPLFGPGCSLELAPLAAALEAGSVSVTEVDEQGDVNCLTVHNRGPIPVLIFDGEELVGAKQNRIANTTVLVPGGHRLELPVSCVEQGRWSYRSREFAVGSMLTSDLRRRKARRVADSLRCQRGYDADQQAVWADVAAYATRRGANSPTGALADVIERDRGDLDRFVVALPAQPGQLGLAAYLDGELMSVDVLATASAFAALYPRLVAAIAAEAIERPRALQRKRRTPLGVAFRRLANADVLQSPSPGLGTDIRLQAGGFAATALVARDQVVHLAVYPSA
jgi:hypothetical protein